MAKKMPPALVKAMAAQAASGPSPAPGGAPGFKHGGSVGKKGKKK